MKLTQIVARTPYGHLAGLASDGSIWEQAKETGSRLTWRRVDMTGIDADRRYVSLATHNGQLLTVNSNGQVYRQVGDGRLGSASQWVPVPLDGLKE
jgi:hypothetical protein